MFAKFTLILCLFTSLSALAHPEDCAESLVISPILKSAARKEALMIFNSSPMMVMRYVQDQVIRTVGIANDGTVTFQVDVRFRYSQEGELKNSILTVRLDAEGNSLITPGSFVRHPGLNPGPRVERPATGAAQLVKQAVRDFIEAKTPGRIIKSVRVQDTVNTRAGEKNFSITVKVTMPPIGDRLQFYNAVVTSGGSVRIVETGTQG